MPNIKSAMKRVKVNAAKKLRNQMTKSELRTTIKKANIAITEGGRELADSELRLAVSKIDKAVKKGILHKNTAARKKSALALKLNRIAQ